MDWIQALTVMGVLGGFLIYHANRVDNNIKELASRLDEHIMSSTQRMDNFSQRLDQLYGMFIDLLKEGRK